MTARDLPPRAIASQVSISDVGDHTFLVWTNSDRAASAKLTLAESTALRDWLTTWIEARQPPQYPTGPSTTEIINMALHNMSMKDITPK